LPQLKATGAELLEGLQKAGIAGAVRYVQKEDGSVSAQIFTHLKHATPNSNDRLTTGNFPHQYHVDSGYLRLPPPPAGKEYPLSLVRKAIELGPDSAHPWNFAKGGAMGLPANPSPQRDYPLGTTSFTA
jgi:hypothetical protein